MLNQKLKTRLERIYNRINGSTVEFELNPYYQVLSEIKACKQTLEYKTECELKQISIDLSEKACERYLLDDLLVEAFALVSEVVQRFLLVSPFDVQIIGGIA